MTLPDIMAARWRPAVGGGVSGSSEDSDLECEWVERWVGVLVFVFEKKDSFLLPPTPT